jgi:hypothetical protein
LVGGEEGNEGGEDGVEVEEEVEEEAEEEEVEVGGGRGVSAMGLLRRMCRMADDKTYGRQTQRLAALRWIAATATSLRSDLRPTFFPLMLIPLYRICEGAAPSPDPVKARPHPPSTRYHRFAAFA